MNDMQTSRKLPGGYRQAHVGQEKRDYVELLPRKNVHNSCGILVESLWDPCGVLMGSLWNPCGILVGSLRVVGKESQLGRNLGQNANHRLNTWVI